VRQIDAYVREVHGHNSLISEGGTALVHLVDVVGHENVSPPFVVVDTTTV
jgi:hypothetical protein